MVTIHCSGLSQFLHGETTETNLRSVFRMSDCSLAIAQGGNKNSLGKFIISRKMIQHTQGLIYKQTGALELR